MKKTLLIVGLLLLGVVVVAASAGFFAVGTDAGRTRLAAFAEAQISTALGGEARIGSIGPGLPSSLTVTDVVLSDAEGPWLRLPRARLVWRPAALLGARLVVEDIEVDGLSLLRQPPASDAPKEPKPPSPPPSLADLPKATIKTLTIRDMTIAEDAFGAQMRLNASGEADVGPEGALIELTAATVDEADAVRVSLEMDRGERLAIDAIVESVGALAKLACGPVRVSATGGGPANALAVDLNLEAGAYGTGTARLEADVVSLGEATAIVNFDFGERLAAVADAVGPTARLRATATATDGGARIDLAAAEAEIGRLSGVAEAAFDDDALRIANFEGSFAPGEPGANDIAQAIETYVGGPIDLSASASPAGDEYAVAVNASGPKLRVALRDAVSDLASKLSGDVEVGVAKNDALPGPLAGGASLVAKLEADAASFVSVTDAAARLTAGGAFDGKARYDLDPAAIDVDGALVASKAFINGLVGDGAVTARGGFRGRVKAAGPLDDLTLTAYGSAPALSAPGANGDEPVRISDATFEASFKGLPMRPDGRLRATPVDGAGGIDMIVRSPRAEEIVVEKLSVSGALFALTGDGSWRLDAGSGRIDARFEGEPGATPWPGVPLEGAATISGAASAGDDGAATLKVEADRLVSASAGVAGLKLNAEGPRNAVRTEMSLTRLDAGGLVVQDLALALLADLAGDPSIDLQDFAAIVADIAVKTRAPAKIAFADGVTIDGLDLSIGDRGAATADLAVSPTRWRVDARASDAPLPGALALLDFDVALDTDEATVARGSFRASAINPPEDDDSPVPAAIGASFEWDGREVAIRDDDAAPELDFSARAPVALTRGEALGVDVAGDLTAQATFDGRVEDYAAFAPPGLETLEGALSLKATANGAIEAPTIDATLTFADGAYTELASGVSFVDIGAELIAKYADGLDATLSARAAGAGQEEPSIFVDGTLNRRADGASATDVRLRLDDALISGGLISRLQAHGEVALTGALPAPGAAEAGPAPMRIAGEIEIDALDVDLAPPSPSAGFVDVTLKGFDVGADANEPIDLASDDGAPAPPPDAMPIGLDVKITAPDELFVRGFGLETEWRADLSVKGTSVEPLILGAVRVRRGTLDFAGRRFDVTQGEAVFDRLTPNDPSIKVRAEYETPEDVLAAIVISGRATAPSLGLESNPSLPREDIMAIVLFGKPANELSALESLQVAQTLASLSGVGGGGGPGLTGGARSALGLDLLNVDFVGGDTNLEVGKYVADGLFVSANQNARGDGGSVRVQYEVNRAITVEAELQQDGDQTVSANWKRDF
ncbi:MAG: translocation/assembly module TamB domain-containing protein [Parvularculaceae bacterium]